MVNPFSGVGAERLFHRVEYNEGGQPRQLLGGDSALNKHGEKSATWTEFIPCGEAYCL